MYGVAGAVGSGGHHGHPGSVGRGAGRAGRAVVRGVDTRRGAGHQGSAGMRLSPPGHGGSPVDAATHVPGSLVHLGGKSFTDVLSTRLRISKREARRRIEEAEDLAPRTALSG